MFQIESRSQHWSSRAWSPDGIGDSNEFASPAEAEAMIAELRKLGEDWAAAEYRVVEVPQS